MICIGKTKCTSEKGLLCANLNFPSSFYEQPRHATVSDCKRAADWLESVCYDDFGDVK